MRVPARHILSLLKNNKSDQFVATQLARFYSLDANEGKDLVVEKLSGKHSGVTVFGLNRPDRKNAFGVNIVNQMNEQLDDIKYAGKARVLVVRSLVNGIFCSGADLKERVKMSPNEVSQFVKKLRSLINKFHHLPIPVIAAMDGGAFAVYFTLNMDYINIEENDDLEIIEFIEFGLPRETYYRNEHFHTLDDVAFRRRFRLTKDSVLLVLGAIQHHLEFPYDLNNCVSPINQLLVTLRLYSTGGHLLSIADFGGMHTSTVCRIVKRVTVVIASLYAEYIKFPENDEIRRTQQEFYNVASFPRVVGALDCSHIKIQSPGGGLELSLACDLRIASTNVKLGLVETKLAIIPGAGGTQRLARLINPAIAKELIYTARVIDATKAAALGIVNQTVEQNGTGDASFLRSLELCEEMLQNGPVALKMAKAAINRGLEADLHTGLAIEEACYAQVIPTRDRTEALEAFLAKRKANFIGE